MLVRRVAPLCLLLTPQVAFAAPSADRPPVQRPSAQDEAAPASPEQSGDQSVSENTSDAPAAEEPDPGAPAPDTPAPAAPAAGEGTDLPTGPATETPGAEPSPTAPASSAATDPEQEPDLSHLLDSDEPEAGTERVRVARRSGPERVDRDERLRNHYARIYRPEHNPARLYFAARGSYALSGTAGTNGGGQMGAANVELGQTWNVLGYGIGATVLGGGLTYGDNGVENFGGFLIGGGPSIGLGRVGLLGRGFIDVRAGYNFFYAPVSTTRAEMADPPDAAPHGPKLQLDAGLLFHGTESRRFRHGLGASIGWQGLFHSLAGDYPTVNTFMVGFGYFFS